MLQLNFLYFLSFKEIYFFGNLTGFKIILFFVGKYTEYYGMLQQTTSGLAKFFCPLQEKKHLPQIYQSILYLVPK